MATAVAEQCLKRGQLALTSSSTMVQAVSEFHCALQGPPALAAPAHRGLALAYAELGERDKAREHLEACLKIEPTSCDSAEVERRLTRQPPHPGQPSAAGPRP